MKHVAGQALRVDPHHDALAIAGPRRRPAPRASVIELIFEGVHIELTKRGRQLRFRHLA